MVQVNRLTDIVSSLDHLPPLRSCQEIGSELNSIISQLTEQRQEDAVDYLDAERLACLLTIRATILSSYNKTSEDSTPQERIVGMVGYSDGSQWPDPNTLGPETFQYLHSRAVATSNPVLKARYYDLVFEKSDLPGKHQSGLAAIDSYLESARLFAETRLSRYQMEMINDMDQAAFLALKLNNRSKIHGVVQFLMTLINRQSETIADEEDAGKYPVGRWALELSRILMHVRQSKKHGEAVTNEDLSYVKDLVRDLAASNVQQGHGHMEGPFLKVASQAARLLNEASDEYNLELRRGEAMVRQGETSEQQEGNGPRHLIAASFFETAAQHYQMMTERLTLTVEQRDELSARTNILKLRIREMYRAGRSEFGQFEVPIELPAEELEQMLDDFLAPDTLEACLRLIVTDGSLLPNLESAQQAALEVQEQAPLLLLFPKRNIQNDVTVSVAETEPQKLSQQIHDTLLLWIQVNSGIILSKLFALLQETKGLNAASLTRYLRTTGLFDEGNLVLIESGAERYFAGDYISALHILVPQFEDVLRGVFERGGRGVIQPRRGQSGWEVETFGKFLTQDAVKDALPPEILIYIRLVMTEQAGWNLRNRVAHGLIRPQDCNILTTMTVLHLLLLLTLFKASDTTINGKGDTA